MQARLKKLVYVLAPMVIAGQALAEKGFLHEGTDPGSVLRTDYGECWTTIYRDAGLPIDPSCTGDADMDGVADSLEERSKLSSMGMGEAQPIADNGTSAGRAMNRRVELQVK